MLDNKLQREICWYTKNKEEKLVNKENFNQNDLTTLRNLFNISDENDLMYNAYEIKTKEQINYIQKYINHKIDISIYDYFLEC